MQFHHHKNYHDLQPSILDSNAILVYLRYLSDVAGKHRTGPATNPILHLRRFRSSLRPYRPSRLARLWPGDSPMKLFLLFGAVGAWFSSCTMIQTQHGTAQFWGDYENVYFHDGAVTFSATSMNHSHVVRAHWHGAVLLGGVAVSSAIPGVGVGGRVVGAAVPSVVSGFTQPPRATPAPLTPANVASPQVILVPPPHPTKP
jgi:hypothetical protein